MTPQRLWFARECNMTADPKVSALADAYGGIAVLAYTEVLALAKLEDSGIVDVRFGVLARRAFLDSAEHAKVVLGGMANVSLIDLEASPIHGDDGVLVTVGEWSTWQLHNPDLSDPTAAERMRRYRARRKDGAKAHDRNAVTRPKLESVPENRNGDAKVTPTGDRDRTTKDNVGGAIGEARDPEPPSLKVIDGGGEGSKS